MTEEGTPANINPCIGDGGTDPQGLRSAATLAHLNRLDVPQPESPGIGASQDFATGYSLGLIGGVRSWVSSDVSFSLMR